MYGHLAAAPLAAAGMLVDERHALAAQSRNDWRCESHGDGWGIGYFDGTQPKIVRRPNAACDDGEFAATARAISSPALLGHVRQASVGDRSMANTHPFAYSRWIFAHNGTLQGFNQVLPGLLNEIEADLRQQIAGTTDSEHIFFWLLSRLRAAGESAEGPCRNPALAAQVVAAAIRTLDERSIATHPDTPSRFNFLLTDGAVLLASRYRHSLYWTNCHGPFEHIAGTRGAAIASEPIGEADWAEVPEASVMAIDADLLVQWARV